MGRRAAVVLPGVHAHNHPMSVGRGYLLLGAQLLLGVLVSFGALITLAFADEANRGRPRPPVAVALQWLSLLFALLPVIVAVLVLIARWRGSETFPTLALWSPLLATLVALPLFVVTLRATESVTARSREEAERNALEEVRSSVRAGSDERVCELVNLDPRATADAVERCFAKLEGLKGPALWREGQWFIRGSQLVALETAQGRESGGWDKPGVPGGPGRRARGLL